MPTGPEGQNRSPAAIGNAVKLMRIANAEKPEDYGSVPGKNEAAAPMPGKRGP